MIVAFQDVSFSLVKIVAKKGNFVQVQIHHKGWSTLPYLMPCMHMHGGHAKINLYSQMLKLLILACLLSLLETPHGQGGDDVDEGQGGEDKGQGDEAEGQVGEDEGQGDEGEGQGGEGQGGADEGQGGKDEVGEDEGQGGEGQGGADEGQGGHGVTPEDEVDFTVNNNMSVFNVLHFLLNTRIDCCRNSRRGSFYYYCCRYAAFKCKYACIGKPCKEQWHITSVFTPMC